MEYLEAVRKLRAGEKIYTAELTREQIFMLIHDGITKAIEFDGTIYEWNFIPIDEAAPEDIVDIDQTKTTYARLFDLFRYITNIYNTKHFVAIEICDELFSIEIEILETKD